MGACSARVDGADGADGADFGIFAARDFTTGAGAGAGAGAARALEPFLEAAPFAAEPFAAEPFAAEPFAAEALAAGGFPGAPRFESASCGASAARPPDPEAIAIVFLLILSKVLSTPP